MSTARIWMNESRGRFVRTAVWCQCREEAWKAHFCLWAGIKGGAKVKFWLQKPFWDLIHKWINVWSSTRKMVAQWKREKEKRLSFIGTSVFALVHYGLVHSILPPNQSVRSSPGAHDKGQQQAPTSRTMAFCCSIHISGRLPRSSNPRYSSAALKCLFTPPSSGLC